MLATALTLILLGATTLEAAPDAANHPPQSLAGKVILVPDGDTIVLKVGDRTERVRLLGTTMGRTAHAGAAAWLRTTHLEALTKGQFVTVDAGLNPTRSNGALLGQVYRVSDDLWVNLEMIQAGYSWSSAAIPFPEHARFHAAEVEARGRKAGLWSPDELAAAAVEFDQLAAAKHDQVKNQLQRVIAVRRAKHLRIARAMPRFAMPAQSFPVFPSAAPTYSDDDARRRRDEDDVRRRRDEDDDRRRIALQNDGLREQGQRQREEQQQREAEIERRRYVAQMQEIARERMVEQQRAFMQQSHAQQQQAYFGVQERSSGGRGQMSEPAHHAEAPAHHEEPKHDPHKK